MFHQSNEFQRLRRTNPDREMTMVSLFYFSTRHVHLTWVCLNPACNICSSAKEWGNQLSANQNANFLKTKRSRNLPTAITCTRVGSGGTNNFRQHPFHKFAKSRSFVSMSVKGTRPRAITCAGLAFEVRDVAEEETVRKHDYGAARECTKLTKINFHTTARGGEGPNQ